ncbi:MAG: DUF484 family protein [Comamonadaceae bacterium]|jgi:uncharacterized protein|uniref:DUF484 family protein n=1 Tax=Candidatus Skiveiella danica TaxID=3386177 RepID=UPI0009C64D52|nr:DUF484 family protein [Comamonadaceae bacterium]MBK9197931.1 DUF484 family protein [Betaproteobacteria bacterium]OQC04649.1 MAG: hypothetical protein BWX79_02454 [Alphaproteobacteria bacterium ADurb.Bin100]
MTSSAMNPITEDDIADFLLNTPDFFGRHAELLSAVLLTSPHGNRAVSLQERQAEMLREKIKLLEHRIMDMIRHGNENMIISDRLQRWARRLFLTASPQALPHAMAEGLQEEFMVPQVAVKVWGVADAFAGEPFAQGVSNDVKSLASSLMAPYVGANAGFEAVGWLPDASRVASVALIALRNGTDPQAFGLMVLASPDSQRFHAGMGTDFLERMAELGSAALSRLRPA